jgi:hypothetical protein
VDAIIDTRGLSFQVLEPILERAKPESLMVIEDFNSYLTEHTGRKEFREKGATTLTMTTF